MSLRLCVCVSRDLEPRFCTIRCLTTLLIYSRSLKKWGEASWLLFNFLFPFSSLIHHSDLQLKQDDEVTMVQVKEQGQSVLVLKKVASCGPAPTSGSAENDVRWESPQPKHARSGFLPWLLPFPAPSHSLARSAACPTLPPPPSFLSASPAAF